MQQQFPSFEQARVLVIGDVMLDRYCFGDTKRVSPEAPVPIVNVSTEEERPGGAANVALNIHALGAKVSLLGLIGDDAAGQCLQDKLDEVGIAHQLQSIPHAKTITKMRIIGQNQQLLRLDIEQGYQAIAKQPLLLMAEKQLADVDILVLSDYAKGTLSEVQALIQLARKKQVLVLVDPKGTDFKRYRGTHLLTPNRREFEAIVGECTSDEMLISKGMELLKRLELEVLLITRGEQGMTLLRKEQSELHFPAQSHEVYDVTGAGDTVIGVLATAIAVGIELPDAVALANFAAGLAVTRLGAVSISHHELRRTWQHWHHGCDDGVLTQQQLLEVIMDSKVRSERIVMTNGCFDVLHAGHVRCLQQAKALGHRLVVAVNSDESVTRLKGPDRPINPLAQRMMVLAALECVDWVVPFAESTPANLIVTLTPDVLVKGGDYTNISDIAGAEHVLAHGGEVKILNHEYVNTCSTSVLINKLEVSIDT